MSYEAALEAAGCEVIDSCCFGSYQGEQYALVRLAYGVGIVEGCYGSCSGCDAFEAEFGYHSKQDDDYQERLSSFGESYLPALPLEHYLSQLELRVKEHEWDSEAVEMLDQVKKWARGYTDVFTNKEENSL